MTIEKFLPPEELLVLRLRKLFGGHGYRKYRMGTLEEYELYADNKAFLRGESIITFHDARGKLMALKPDVTLSIVKNSREVPGGERLYYLESVYRLQANGEYREIPQMGLECIGCADRAATLEVLDLALQSLKAAGRPFLLEISHMGLVNGIMSAFLTDAALFPTALDALSRKSAEELYELGVTSGLSHERATLLAGIVRAPRPGAEALDHLFALGGEPISGAIGELRTLLADLSALGWAGNVRIDLSAVNSIDYYNGIIFKGYVDGVPRAALAGGRYDNLMRRFGRDTEAIGFAIYMDELTRVLKTSDEYDLDALILYGPDTNPLEIAAASREISENGGRVSVRPEAPENLRYRRVIDLRAGRQEAENA